MKRIVSWIESNLLIAVYALWFIFEFPQSTSFSGSIFYPKYISAFQVSGYLKYLLLLAVLLTRKYSLKQWVMIAASLSLLLITGIQAEYLALFSTALFLFCCRREDMDRLVKVTLILSLILILVTVLLCWFGVLEDRVSVRKGITRHALGFTHPNSFGFRFLVMMMSWLYLRFNRLNAGDFLLCAVIVSLVWIVPNSMTSFAVMLFAFFLCLFFSVGRTPSGFLVKLFGVGMAEVSVFSHLFMVVIALSYKPEGVFNIINRFLTSRPNYSSNAVKAFGIHFFGNIIDNVDRETGEVIFKDIIDSAYIDILLRYGLVVFLLLTALFAYAVLRENRIGARNNAVMLTVTALYGIGEIFGSMVFRNIFIVPVAFVFTDDNGEERKTVYGWFRQMTGHKNAESWKE